MELSPQCPEWIRVHRTSRLLKTPKGGMPRSRPGDACVDAAAWARSDREALFIVITCLNKRLVTARDLERALRDRPNLRRRNQVLEAAAEFSGGAMSVGEVDFSRLCRKFGIRPPDRQVRRKSTRGTRCVDAYWDAERVVVEIDGAGHADICSYVRRPRATERHRQARRSHLLTRLDLGSEVRARGLHEPIGRRLAKR